MSLRILTEDEVIGRYGDFRPYLADDGFVLRAWEDKILMPCFFPASLPLSWGNGARVSRFRCHLLVALDLTSALNELYFDCREAWETIGDFGGVYAFRANRNNRRRPSRHCWAIAIDLDVNDNPNGAPGDVHPDTIAVMERHGFIHGASFRPMPDPMHWEIGIDE